MEGTVSATNPPRRMVAIETKDQGFTIVEVLGKKFDVAVGDRIQWDDDTGLGEDTYQILDKDDKGRKMRVIVHHHLVGHNQVTERLLVY